MVQGARILLVALLACAGCGQRAVHLGDGGASPLPDLRPIGDAPSAPDAHDPCRQLASWNPFDRSSGMALAPDNLAVVHEGASLIGAARATIGLAAGKYYWELSVDRMGEGVHRAVGLLAAEHPIEGGLMSYEHAVCRYDSTGKAVCGPNGWRYVEFFPFRQGDVVGVAVDLDAPTGKLYFSRNGEWVPASKYRVADDPVAGSGGIEIFSAEQKVLLFPAVELSRGDRVRASFGQSHAYPAPAGYAPGWFQLRLDCP